MDVNPIRDHAFRRLSPKPENKMKITHLLSGVALLISLAVPALAGDVYVQGYTRSDGTYVAPYHRTSPDSSLFNNYSTQGNVNPYTGQMGTVNPYSQPNSNPYGSSYSNPYSNPYGGR
jgi:hypothetical protein